MNPIAGTEWLSGLENSGWVDLMRQWIWFYPMIETMHILGLAILFGTVVMFDLRLLGVSRHLLVTDMAHYLLPWSYLSFGIVLLSGFLMFAIDATQIAANPAFQLKLMLILGAGINAAVFHSVPFKTVKLWNRGVESPTVVKFIAVTSLLLWTAIITCGRLIAYV